jgi:hypothetical protein
VAWLVFTVGALIIMTLRSHVQPGLLLVVLALGVVAVLGLRSAHRSRAALLRRKEHLTRPPQQ